MSKYINSEELIAEIERREKIIRNSANQISDSEKKTYYSDCADALLELLPFITSLQQEQPFPRWIHANYSEKPEIRHSPSGDPYLQNGPYMIWLSDLETLPKDGTDLTNPGQEQPEVDLEKEIDGWYNTMGIPITADALKETARHFYELGLNARKEECK